MKNLLIFLVILLGCSKKETENINVYKITVSYLGSQDAPHPIIILTKGKPNVNDFPKVNYQVENEDLVKIEKTSYSKIIEYNKESLILVQVNKDNEIKEYFFNKKNGVEILEKIRKIIFHFNDKQLNNDLIDLELATKQNWHSKQ